MNKNLLITLIPLSLMVFCVNEYNPFDDMENVKIIISNNPFSSNDSVKLFSKEELTVSLVLKEHIDSLKVNSPKNRLWTTIVIPAGSIPGDKYTLNFSFKDTGKEIISLDVYRDNNTLFTQEVSCYIYSPLYQKPIKKSIDDSIELSTLPVDDDNITYCWDFGFKQIESFSTPTKKCLLSNTSDDSIGWLWVIDSSGNTSPKTPFQFLLFDITAPRIICLNDSCDTIAKSIRTGDTGKFAVTFSISDRGGNPVNNASINGNPFGKILNQNIYTHILDSIGNYTKQDPYSVVIFAEDFESVPNEVQETYRVWYDSTIPPTHQTLIIIKTDTDSFTTTDFHVFGEVINFEKQPVLLKISLNTVSIQNSISIPDGNGEWAWKITLKEKIKNLIEITAQDTNNLLLAKENIIVYYEPNFEDTEPPEILAVTVEGQSDLSKIISNNFPKVSVTVSDKKSPIKEVTIEGAQAVTDTFGHVWSSRILLENHVETIDITCKDKAGNKTDTVVTLLYNTLPFLTSDLSYPQNLKTDTLYIDTIEIEDGESDSITVSISNPLPGLSLSTVTNNRCILTWNTNNLNPGNTDTIHLNLRDTMQDTTYTWGFKILDTLETYPPVKFKTTGNHFPDLEVGQGIFSLTLAVVDTTGKKPLRYTVYIQDLKTYLLNNDPDSTILWNITNSQIGRHQLIVSVSDDLGTSDTIFPLVTVVPENSDQCTLSVATVDTSIHIDFSTNTLDLSAVFDTVTLIYTIHDSDHPITEHHTVTKKMGNLTTTFDPDTGFFTIAITPKTNVDPDTLLVTVVDSTGTPFALPLYIIYPTVMTPDEVDSLAYWFDTTEPDTVPIKNGTSSTPDTSVYYWKNRRVIIDKTENYSADTYNSTSNK